MYYSLGIINERKEGKYLVQTRLRAKSSSIRLPEVHGIGKGIDQNIAVEKQVIKAIITFEAKGIFHMKPRLGQGRAGINEN